MPPDGTSLDLVEAAVSAEWVGDVLTAVTVAATAPAGGFSCSIDRAGRRERTRPSGSARTCGW